MKGLFQCPRGTEGVVKTIEGLGSGIRPPLFARGGQGSRKICVHLCNQWDNVKNQKFLGNFRYFPYICSM